MASKHKDAPWWKVPATIPTFDDVEGVFATPCPLICQAPDVDTAVDKARGIGLDVAWGAEVRPHAAP